MNEKIKTLWSNGLFRWLVHVAGSSISIFGLVLLINSVYGIDTATDGIGKILYFYIPIALSTLWVWRHSWGDWWRNNPMFRFMVSLPLSFFAVTLWLKFFFLSGPLSFSHGMSVLISDVAPDDHLPGLIFSLLIAICLTFWKQALIRYLFYSTICVLLVSQDHLVYPNYYEHGEYVRPEYIFLFRFDFPPRIVFLICLLLPIFWVWRMWFVQVFRKWKPVNKIILLLKKFVDSTNRAADEDDSN